METRMTTHLPSRVASLVLGLALLVGTPAACSSGGPSKDELRAKTKSVLIKGGMTAKQADCYVKSLNDNALERFGKGDATAANDPAVVRRATKCFGKGN